MFKKLIGNSTIIFVGTIIASIFSYLFNMLMGRMLGPEAYGEMSALMSLLMIVAVGSGAILTVSMRYSGELFTEGKIVALKKLFVVFSKYVFGFSIAIFLIGIALSRIISDFFSITSVVPVIIILSAIIISFIMMVNRGFLQGTQKFISLSGIGVVEMFLRLTIGIILVKVGFGLNGAVGALVLSTAVAYIISIFLILPIFKKKSKDSDFKFDKGEIIRYSAPTLVVAIILAALLNIDIILIKHYFPAEDAGLYAAVSTVAKIIFYLLAPITSVMFPMISEQRTKKKKHYKIFLYSLLLTIAGGLLIVGAYVIAPGGILKLLYGSEYTSFFYLLPEVGILMLFYTLINLVAFYFMAVKNFVFVWASIIIILIQIVTVALWHPSIVASVRVFVLTEAILFLIMLGYYVISKKDQILQHIRGD